jgi:AraC-like DNA-binding protein
MLSDPLPQAAPSRHDNHAMATGEVTLPLLDAFRRLLELADRPQDVPVLAPLLQREIVYRLLTGEAGGRLRQIASADSQGHHIARAVKRLKTAYAEPLRVEDLAKEARMSVSTFHHRFKALTAMSPLQYQKRLRLAEARRMMLAENVDASTAAYRVGYESASQFSREYKRQFGAPPTLDIVGLREVAGARQS